MLLLNMKSNIKIFNSTFLSNFNHLLINHLKKINLINYQNFMTFFQEAKLKIYLNETNQTKPFYESLELQDDQIEKVFAEKLIPFEISFMTNNFNNNFINEDLTTNIDNKNKKNKLNVNINNKNSAVKILKLIQDFFAIYEIGKNFTLFTNSSNSKTKISKKADLILSSNYTEKRSWEPIDQQLGIFKHINLIYLTNKNSNDGNLNIHKKIFLNGLRLLNNKLNLQDKINIYFKIAYISDETFIGEYNNLFTDLSFYNSKYLLDELADDKYLNILISDSQNHIRQQEKIIAESKKHNFDIFYNSDVQNFIFVLNLNQYLSLLNNNTQFNDENNMGPLLIEDLLNLFISIKTINNSTLLSEIIDKNNLNGRSLYEFIQIDNSITMKFYKMLGKVLYDLDKINKIFFNYESSRNVEMIKQKVYTK